MYVYMCIYIYICICNMYISLYNIYIYTCIERERDMVAIVTVNVASNQGEPLV